MAMDLQTMGRAARTAARRLAVLKTEEKDRALHAIADELEAQSESVLVANAEDIEAAKRSGMDEALVDRLLLTADRVTALASDVRSVATLSDPVGEEFDHRELPNGMKLYRRRVPLGVVGVIYEARPNVTIDIASLCLKTGNAAILRGGSETLRSNSALVQVIRVALEQSGLPVEAVQYIEDPDRARVAELLRMDDYVDMIIPRGGEGLHRLCREKSTIPVITGGIGICHLYVDETADLERAVDVIENAKVQRPSVCNALDTLLMHRDAAPRLAPTVAERLRRHGVTIHADEAAMEILRSRGSEEGVEPAGPGDFDREWLSLHLGLRVVDDLEGAISHIQTHGTAHSDGILTGDDGLARRFIDEVDSAAVYVNASTRFTDGGQFGLGAEVAVSTQKLHARGPMGLEALTTYKWIGVGEGHIRT